jgi:glycosyltransferase involved in cell wall biosynthesis
MSQRRLKIVLLSYHNQNGGAGIACGRLYTALKKAGHQVHYLVQEKTRNDDSIALSNSIWSKLMAFIRFVGERLYFRFFEKDKSISFLFNPGIFGTDISQHPLIKDADIIHLHWVNFGFLSIQNIRQLTELGKPIFWTLHDMWAFTGGCHHSGDCDRYKEFCGQCKFLKQPSFHDLSHRLWREKVFAFESDNLRFIPCSNWLAKKAKESSLLMRHEIHAIPNAIDLTIFKSLDKNLAKKNLQLSIDKSYLLFVAMRVSAPNKGFEYLKSALEIWKNSHPNDANKTEVLIIGEVSNIELLDSLPLAHKVLGKITDEKQMVEIYNASDVFITPSLEENLPNTIMEALSCGTSCLGFEVGGIPEMIDHLSNGYVAKFKDKEDLANGIQVCLENKLEFGRKAREKAEQNYAEMHISDKHVQLYINSLNNV